MKTVSYFQNRLIIHGTCALSDYFDLLTFSLKTMTFTLKILSVLLLGNYKWQLLHICREYQPVMDTVHCRIYLTFWHLAVTLWLLPWKPCLAHCSETINDNYFLFSRHINLVWDLCTVVSLTFVLDIMTFDIEICLSKSCLGPVLRNYTWHLFHIFTADQSYMEPVHDLWLWKLVRKLLFSPVDRY